MGENDFLSAPRVEGIMFDSHHDVFHREKVKPTITDLEQFFPHSDKAGFSDHYALSEFEKQENKMAQYTADHIRQTSLKTALEKGLDIQRSGKHSDYLLLEEYSEKMGEPPRIIGVRRLKGREHFENDEAYAFAVRGFENGIRLQDVCGLKKISVPGLSFLIREKKENGEYSFYCGMEHIDGFTLGQICNPDGMIPDMEMYQEEVDRNIESALDQHPEIRSWPFEELLSRVEKQLSLCHSVEDGMPSVVHRDCHEDNVIFTFSHGEPVLIDFDDGLIGSSSDPGFASRLETYRSDVGDLCMTDFPLLDPETGKAPSNAIDNLRKYVEAIARVVRDTEAQSGE